MSAMLSSSPHTPPGKSENAFNLLYYKQLKSISFNVHTSRSSSFSARCFNNKESLEISSSFSASEISSDLRRVVQASCRRNDTTLGHTFKHHKTTKTRRPPIGINPNKLFEVPFSSYGAWSQSSSQRNKVWLLLWKALQCGQTLVKQVPRTWTSVN